MDISISEGSAKKVPLEDLPKEELIKKIKNLLVIAQKAKQSKDVLNEENSALKEKLKCVGASDELIENLTQQKLRLVTELEELKEQRKALDSKLAECEEQLYSSETKVADLDTENQSCKRQVNRLSDENEQLIAHLDELEKQIEELKRIGLVQQEQLLTLEKNNALLTENVTVVEENEELKRMLGVSLDKVNNLTSENTALKEKLDATSILIEEKTTLIETKDTELTDKSNLISELEKSITSYRDQIAQLESSNNNAELLQKIEKLQAAINESAESIQVYQQEIDVKTKEIEKHTNNADDLHTELHKNRALIEKLKQDLATMSSKFKDNQIMSSGLTTDLENINDKLRDKVKFYHTKIVKFAGDVKKLKESRKFILDDFKLYSNQVNEWREQLILGTQRLLKEINNDGKEKQHLKCVVDELNGKILELNKTKELLIKETEQESIDSDQKSLLIAENKELVDKLNVLTKEIEDLRESHKQLETTHSDTLGDTIKEYELKIERINEEYSITLSQIKEKCSNEVKTLKEELNNMIKLKDQNGELLKNINDLNTTKEQLEKSISENNVVIEENNKLVLHLKTAIEKLESEVEASKSTEAKLAEQSGQEIIKLANENKELRDKNMNLEGKIGELEGRKSENSNVTEELEEKINSLKRENAELLAEMNEMNQVLKERGETISKQQAYCDEILKKISVYESQANKNVDTISQNAETIKRLEDEITRLSNEVTSLKDKLVNDSYAESETLSTSTISRCEEVSRLKDLEGSWEERYGKLRNLALKLKGKIRELTTELNKEQAEKSELQTKLASTIKVVQTTQLQCDNLNDKLDALKTENRNYVKKLEALAVDISKDKKELASNNENISKLKNEVDTLTKDKVAIDNWKKQVGLKVQSLKKELDANSVMKKEFESQVQKLKVELEAKEIELKDEKDKHSHTKKSLQESTNDSKKQSVLTLEIQDYEKSVKDITQKLERKNELVTKLKNQIDSQKSTVNTVTEQNRLLEERSKSLEMELDACRIEVNAFKKTISELEIVQLEKDGKVQEIMKVLEDCRSENEELSTQLSTVMGDHQKTVNLLKSEKDSLRSENIGFDQRVRELENSMKLKEDELGNIQQEYQGYKVRAQSVLRQNQSRDVGLEEKLSEEAATLRAQVDILKSEIVDLKINVDKLSIENDKLKMEIQTVGTSKLEVISESDELRKEFEKVNAKYQQAVMEHAETVRGLKIHTDTLAQCYRQQISEQEARHNREIIELQGKLERGAAPPDIPPLILPNTPREEGEGSESVDSNNGNVHPLERLLGSDQEHEISGVKKQLAENESKVVHLTALLADTEQDLAKHVQMNNVLKEEIRRQQRSVEREKHAENLEYMKNVVFKFITLNNCDERQRLVPVLNTILKLSPEETQKLNMVARGDRSWSDYLPLWSSSSSKPQ